jgi:hypothetical protein
VLRGLHDCVCSLNAKFDRHETPLRALQACCQLIGLASSTETCLMHSRRTLPNGDPDPTDTSKQRPDLVIYDFHNGGPNPTLVDITVTHPTARCHSRLPERVGVAARSREVMKNRKCTVLYMGCIQEFYLYGSSHPSPTIGF